MSRPARKRTRARFGLTATHTGAHGVSHLVSSLADILEVLLRAGFVPSTPGTPELCSSAYTLQVALCAQSICNQESLKCIFIQETNTRETNATWALAATSCSLRPAGALRADLQALVIQVLHVPDTSRPVCSRVRHAHARPTFG